jgi:hypothetical protein
MKTRPNLGLAIVGGFVGTPAMTVAVYLIATLVHVKMNIVDTLATMLGGWKMGMLVHVLNGAIVFPLAYAVFFYRFLLGPSYVKGLAFGLTLWLASQLVVLPMIGAGVFSSHMGGVRAGGAIERRSVAEPRTKQAA